MTTRPSDDQGDTTVVTERLRLVAFSAAFLRASLAGHLAVAADDLGARLPASWPEPWRRFLEIRMGDLEADPSAGPWLLRGVVLDGPDPVLIGIIGLHGRPGPDASVEIGYSIEPPFRRRGFAEEAVIGLCTWAHEVAGVALIRASISPDNAPSLGLVRKLGFVRTGSRWDDEDGEEHTFERHAWGMHP